MKPSNNEFINTCIALSLSEEDMIDKKFIGYVVAMVPTYNKSKERDQFNEEVSALTCNANIIAVFILFIKLIHKHHMIDHESWIYTFIDRNKNLVKTVIAPFIFITNTSFQLILHI